MYLFENIFFNRQSLSKIEEYHTKHLGSTLVQHSKMSPGFCIKRNTIVALLTSLHLNGFFFKLEGIRYVKVTLVLVVLRPCQYFDTDYAKDKVRIQRYKFSVIVRILTFDCCLWFFAFFSESIYFFRYKDKIKMKCVFLNKLQLLCENFSGIINIY